MVRLIQNVIYTTTTGKDMTIGCEFSESPEKEEELVERRLAEYVNKTGKAEKAVTDADDSQPVFSEKTPAQRKKK